MHETRNSLPAENQVYICETDIYSCEYIEVNVKREPFWVFFLHSPLKTITKHLPKNKEKSPFFFLQEQPEETTLRAWCDTDSNGRVHGYLISKLRREIISCIKHCVLCQSESWPPPNFSRNSYQFKGCWLLTYALKLAFYHNPIPSCCQCCPRKGHIFKVMTLNNL